MKIKSQFSLLSVAVLWSIGAILLSSLPLSANETEQKTEQTKQTKLYEQFKQKDSVLFENTFGQCNIKTIERMIAKDFEFYHDKGGVTESKKAFMTQLKNGNCSTKQKNEIYRSYRVLHEGSLEVFPSYNKKVLYGVLQTGVHSFYESNHGSNLTRGSTAKFSHLWILEDGEWKISRVLSYDHQSPEPWKH